MSSNCGYCGAEIAGTATFCSACGRSLLPATPGADLAPAPRSRSAAGGLRDNIAGALAYITIIPAIIFLFMEPYNKRPFVRFHALQHLFLAAASVALWIAVFVLSDALVFIPIFGHLMVFLLSPVISAGLFMLWLVLLIKAYQGQMWKLPLIGNLAERQALRA